MSYSERSNYSTRSNRSSRSNRNCGESNMVNTGLSSERFAKNNDTSSDDMIKNEDSLIRGIKDLKTTETDMFFQYFANRDKMVDDDDIKAFEKPEKSQYDDYNDRDNYRDNYDDNKRSETSESVRDYEDKNNYDYNPQFKAGKYGPSVGDGPMNKANKDAPSDAKTSFNSAEEEKLAKLNMLRQLGELTEYGVVLSQNYSMNSDYDAMKWEYEMHRSIRDKKNGVKWLSNMMINICYGVELANDKFNPFDFKLKGWSEQMNEDVGEYYDVFGELYEKYFKAGKPIPPELKLFFMISGSAIKFHLTHAMMGSIPNLADMMNKNPALADKLRQQAVNDKMKQQANRQREIFDNAANNEHMMASQKAADIQMLKDKEAEFTMNHMRGDTYSNHSSRSEASVRIQQEIFRKQMELDNLQKQLNQQRSDSRSMYSKSLYSDNNNFNGQQTMAPPPLPASLRNMGMNQNMMDQEAMRQQHIMNHKKMMQQQELYKMQQQNLGPNLHHDDNSSNGSVVNFNPNLDNIISSKVSEMSTIDHSELNDTDDSKVVVKKRRGRRKGGLKIDT